MELGVKFRGKVNKGSFFEKDIRIFKHQCSCFVGSLRILIRCFFSSTAGKLNESNTTDRGSGSCLAVKSTAVSISATSSKCIATNRSRRRESRWCWIVPRKVVPTQRLINQGGQVMMITISILASGCSSK